MEKLWHKFEKWFNTVFRGDDEEAVVSQQNDILFTTPMIEHQEEQLVDKEVLSEVEEETATLDEVSETEITVSETPSMDVIDEITNRVEKEESSDEDTVIKQDNEENAYTSTEGDKRFEKLLSNTLDTIKYYDQLVAQVENPDVRSCLEDFCRKLIENLILSGCTPIDTSEGVFDMTRHRVVPFQMVEDGTPYHKLVRAGVEWDGEVKVMAIVEL
ncbi:MAG: hypothetical protein IKZ52_03665 [Bacteroidales bacterium]|nr:hypothetical protein [Bacteroidales bacterium]